MKKKVFVVGGCHTTKNLFTMNCWEICYSVAAADLICFTGGADVSPHLYGAPKHPTTHTDSGRDEAEIKVFLEAFELSKPMVGICRGGQFLNVMNGGEMYQDVTDHTGNHPLTIVNGEGRGMTFDVTSTHHQMMRPAVHGELLAVGTPSSVEYYDREEERWVKIQLEGGVEVVKYNNHICFQPHPEFRAYEGSFSEMRQYFFTLINSLYNSCGC